MRRPAPSFSNRIWFSLCRTHRVRARRGFDNAFTRAIKIIHAPHIRSHLSLPICLTVVPSGLLAVIAYGSGAEPSRTDVCPREDVVLSDLLIFWLIISHRSGDFVFTTPCVGSPNGRDHP